MRYIAHRGLFKGPNSRLENMPNQINQALLEGYDCEIDLWVFDNRLYLGHDGPQINVTEEYIRNDRFWIHAKNLEALCWLRHSPIKHNYFWHESDKFTLTSDEYIWTNPGNHLSIDSVMVMPEHEDPTLEVTRNAVCHAICSDYVNRIKEIRCD